MDLQHWRHTFCIALALCSIISISIAEDFQFASERVEEVKPMLAEPVDVVSKTQPIKSIYSKEKTHCPSSQNKIILSLVLQSHSWEEIVENKRQKAINKLSKFFLVPKENFIIDDVSRIEIHEMTTNAIRRGHTNFPTATGNSGKRKLGRIGFLIGCGKTIFPGEKLIANTVAQQMKERALDDISGLDFGWWAIWSKQHPEGHQHHHQASKSHPRRVKRQDGADGYGNDEEEDDYDDYYDDEDEAEPTEVPQHAHRHHHGDSSATTPSSVISSSSSSKSSGGGGKSSGKSKEDDYDNYDDEYDDDLEEEATTIAVPTDGRQAAGGVVVPTTESTTPEPTTPSTVPSTSTTPTTTSTTTESTTTSTTSTTPAPTTTSTVAPTTELDEPTNMFPIIKNRIPKQAIIAGKVFSLPVPLETFYDHEDGNNLRLELFDSNGNQLKHSSWIQFNAETREIYGLPLEKDVSKWHYILQATDSGDKTVNETIDISVQQHKSHRSVNHEISLALRLQQKFFKNVDWQLQVIRGIAKVLGDVTLTNVVVREVRNSIQDPNLATFVYTNETLPKDRCPEEKLDELVAQLTETALNDVLKPDILVKSVQGQQIGQCLKSVIPRVKPTQSTIATKNFAPTTRNQVDRVNATVGHLLVFKVPADTFYDPEDGSDLKLKLLTNERNPLDQFHWLQFDSKNHEFYGIPRSVDVGQKEYLLMAEDREGLTATDALIVVVHQTHHKREQSVLFELTLDTTHEQFTIAQAQRRFIERLAQVFGDSNTNYIQIKNIRPIHHTGQIQVTFYNTTLYRQHQRCPDEEIEALRNILLYPDGTIRAKVKEILGQEFSLQNVSLIPMGNCQGYDTPIHVTNEPEKALPPPVAKDDYLLTFVLPAVIILAMLLIASLIACVLYRRRLTGKMELGTDEERKSFRSKGIPVIFQDELDEKPEIGNKSPVILKDEKPPLLPPSYSSTNNDGENEDVDEYVPPPAVVMGGRESRGKSPVTPSYRRPPPYVSP